ncbi:hypothetical protein [Flavobacterium aestivum]|uniref:hypothetical protein n=1 Tax=Flavobacterium aestivum TaxID=3003257 RepID=UPI0024821263|nr:hypothetical protein [Flavobacterium aestivum]
MNIDINELKKGELVLIDNELYSVTYSLYSASRGVLNIKIDKQLGVVKYLDYSLEGKISQVSFNSSSGEAKLFKEYDFDKEGNIVKEIDNDKGYTICWQEAIEICKKLIGERELRKYNIKDFALRRADLNDRPNDTPLWIVRPIARKEDGSVYENNLQDKYYKHNKGDLYYYIDGTTGKSKKKIMKWTLSTNDQL